MQRIPGLLAPQNTGTKRLRNTEGQILVSGSSREGGGSSEGTRVKYEAMATLNRLEYSLGDWMVGAFRSLLSPMPDLTHLSRALSHVYCRQRNAHRTAFLNVIV